MAMVNIAVWYIGKLLRVDPKNSRHKEKSFFFAFYCTYMK